MWKDLLYIEMGSGWHLQRPATRWLLQDKLMGQFDFISVSLILQPPSSDITCTYLKYQMILLTHWGRVTHICIGNLTIIGSDNGLSPGRRQAITWTNVGILLIGPLGTNFNEMVIEIYTFSFKKIHLKMSSGKWQPFCLGLNVLNQVTVHSQCHEWYVFTYVLISHNIIITYFILKYSFWH